MKSIFYSLIFLLVTSNSFSFAQTLVSDTLNVRRGNHYYIDSCKIRGASSLTGTVVQDVTVITGGLPVNYGDIDSSIIQMNASPVPAIPRKVIISNKEQKLATE